MRRAIGFTIVFVLATGTSSAQELGASISGGYSIPGVSRLFCGSVRPGDRSLRELRTAWLYCGRDSEGDLLTAQTNFHRKHAGPVFAGDLFLHIDQFDMGIGTAIFSKGGISGSLFSSNPRKERVKARDFTRSFRAVFVFIRGRAMTDSTLTPTLGFGIGIFGLRESGPYERLNWENGPFIQLFAGGEARIRKSSFRAFTEIRLNFAVFDDIPEPGRNIIRCCGWNQAYLSWTFAIGLRFARPSPAAKSTPYTRMPGR